jgi:extradiol dioxygenase family protein
MNSLFHFAFNVTDLSQTRAFYGGLLGCREGRSTDTWVDFDFFGHQLSMHLGEPFKTAATGRVGDHLVPMPHFGVILTTQKWLELAERLTQAKVQFILGRNCGLPVNPANNGPCSSATRLATRSRSRVLPH